jgi:2-dehydropantoate 2-reductase
MAKVGIIGTGAMGSVYAALMADAGHDVIAVDIWTDHVEAITRDGLRVEGASGDRTVRLPATTDAAQATGCDLVIIATKLDGVSDAARAVAGVLGPETAVLSMQNGLGGPDRAAEILGAERVTVGVVGGFGASMRGPGHAHHNGMEFVRLGEYAGTAGPRLEAIAEIWRSSGFRVLTFDDIHRMVWEKLICNAAYSGPCTVTGLTVGEVMADPHAAAISAECGREAWAVARAKGINIEIDDPLAYIRAFGEKIPHSRPSMAQDHAAGKRGEVDAINGAIVSEATGLGLAVPTNTFVSQVIKARESVFG